MGSYIPTGLLTLQRPLSHSDVKLEKRMNETIIRETQTVKYLGLLIDNDLKWNTHINHISNIVSRNIGIVCRSRHFLTEKHRYLPCI